MRTSIRKVDLLSNPALATDRRRQIAWSAAILHPLSDQPRRPTTPNKQPYQTSSTIKQTALSNKQHHQTNGTIKQSGPSNKQPHHTGTINSTLKRAAPARRSAAARR
jgi:hypothetical protein